MACILFIACNSQSGQVADTSNEATNKPSDSTVLPPDPSMDPANLLPDSKGKIPTPANDPGNKKLADPLEGLNPVHGQPGHRCDVPAGTPLAGLPETVGISLCK